MADPAASRGRFHAAPVLLSLLILLICRSVANVLLWRRGFFAISDDDFARVTIAQQFAQAPRFDPSGTSWLPLPFWLMGFWLKLFGLTLPVAQACAFTTGLIATVLPWLAARWLGLGYAAALLAGLFCTVLPHSLWLGLAMVPEGYTAALALLAVASLQDDCPQRRALGATALLAATLCRYETWPLAGLFTLVTILDVVRGKLQPRALTDALLASLGMIAWLAHGLLTHGSALFFITRVSEYHRALVGGSATLPGEALAYPLLVLRAEPELCALLFAALLLVPAPAGFFARYRRPLVFAALLLVPLVVSSAFGGGATHHLERPLLMIWLLMAIMLADAGLRIWGAPPQRKRAALALAPVVLALALLRERIVYREPFVNRSAEIAIGLATREQLAGRAQPVAVDCKDFGYTAVIAALAMPGVAHPLNTHDPRGASTTSISSLGARWLVADEDSPLLAALNAAPAARRGRFLLLPLAGPAPVP